jgi:maltose O-acetyltransferase
MLGKARQWWWFVHGEVSELGLRFLLWLPLRIGIRARQKVLPYLVGSFGENNQLQPGLRISTPQKLFIGSNCQFNERVTITAGGTVRIGNWVGIGPSAKIWSANHKYSDPDVPYMIQGWDLKEVVVEDDVWIGANAFIMPGVHIGKGAVISAGSVILKSVPSYAIVAGNPGRVIGWRKKMQTSVNLTGSEISER